MIEVDVCVCTYRRASLNETLESLAAQRGLDGVVMRVVVADNDEAPTAEALARGRCAALGLDCRYVHAPARNISVARNAALDAADAALVAFIDDDEAASPGWLAALLDRRGSGDAAIVLGPVQAVYADGPAWLREADLHSIRPVFRGGGAIETGYTCNVLLDRGRMTDEMRACRFDPALGRSGGEDTFFFHRLHRLGARIAFAEAAVVSERVPPGRARTTWLLKRSFRSGQTHARLVRPGRAARLRLAASAALKCAWCAAGAAARAARPPLWRRWAVRAALHAGVVSRLTGLDDLELY